MYNIDVTVSTLPPLMVKGRNEKRNRTNCPKNNLNLCIKTEPGTAGADATAYAVFGFGRDKCKQKPDIYRCICSIRDRLGFVCGDSNYFWQSADAMAYIWFRAR